MENKEIDNGIELLKKVIEKLIEKILIKTREY